MKLLALFALAIFAASSFALMGSAGPANAVDNGTLGIRPATESDFFHLSLAPGSTIDRVAIVTNFTATPVTLLTYVVDGLTTVQGGFALNTQDSVPVSVGLWATLPAPSITVPAESQVEVPFSITVPFGSPPGDYVGGLIIQEPLEKGDVATAADGTAVRLDVIQRQGVRIYLNVAGTSVKKLEVGPLAWTQSGESVTVTLPISNTGNTTLHPTGDIAFSSLLGLNGSALFTVPESITPGSTVVLEGIIDTAKLIQLGQIDATVASEAPTVRATTGFVNIHWWVLVGLTVGVLALAYLIRRQILFTRRARAAFARETRAETRAQTRQPNSGRHV
jgi:hypothetical protein